MIDDRILKLKHIYDCKVGSCTINFVPQSNEERHKAYMKVMRARYDKLTDVNYNKYF